MVGLDLLGKLGTCSEAERAAVIDWVLAQFVLPGDTGNSSSLSFRPTCTRRFLQTAAVVFDAAVEVKI